MTEEAARAPRPGAVPPGGAPPPPGAAPPGTPAAEPWPGAATTPPPEGYEHRPPPPGGAFTSRYGLVRPRDGRYLAGVCAAIGRATNTDPVLWRVLLAVLGFFGGIGILVYVSAWLIIPGEGDSASPVESMLGRGRSSMSPVTVIVLSILVAVSFGYIVTDAFRAVLLGAAILVGGALLLNRENPAPGPPPATGPVPPVPPPPASYGPVPPGSEATTPLAAPTAAPVAATGPVSGAGPGGGGVPVPAAGPAEERTAELPQPAWPPVDRTPTVAAPVDRTAELAGWPPTPPAAPTTAPPVSAPEAPVHPVTAPLPPGGYRAPFAPRGPYAAPQGPYPPAYLPPVPPVKPPKRPRERSPLGAATFSLIFVALGVVAVLDLLDVIDVGASAYFAAALATVGLGLLVGTWFGRARWLIALGLVTAAALGFATVAESYDRIRGVEGDVTWAPASYAELATRYENNFGDAVLDLRAVDFTNRESEITVAINFGQATVVVPPNVDVTTVVDVTAGDATIFGSRSGGVDGRRRETTDLGRDGPGGGKLRLDVHVNAGNLEVTR